MVETLPFQYDAIGNHSNRHAMRLGEEPSGRVFEVPMNRRPVLMVVAAVIERDGQILIGQRKRGDRHAFKWEFPGGKVEAHETPREALVRELREELQIEADIGPEMIRYEFSYGRKAPILLIFHRVTNFTGEPVGAEF